MLNSSRVSVYSYVAMLHTSRSHSSSSSSSPKPEDSLAHHVKNGDYLRTFIQKGLRRSYFSLAGYFLFDYRNINQQHSWGWINTSKTIIKYMIYVARMKILFNSYFEVHQGSYKWDRMEHMPSLFGSIFHFNLTHGRIHIAQFPVSKSRPR